MKNDPLLKSLRISTVKRNQKKVDAFEGFFVDIELNAKIVLMAVSRGMSKSEFLRSIVSDWMKDKDPIGDVLSYVKGLKKEHNLSNEELATKLQLLLAGRGVPEEQITKLINHVKKLK